MTGTSISQPRAPGFDEPVIRGQILTRVSRLCRAAVTNFALDLAGLRVLTEAATGPFAVTPVIAALAGADEVVAVTRDSQWGSARSAIDQVRKLADHCGTAGKIRFVTGPAADAAQGCHLVTNLGFVRPIDARLIQSLAPNAAVALMWEPWEFRAEEIEIDALVRHEVALVGTNEQHPLVRTMEYLGPTVARLLLEAGIEILGSSLIVVGSDPFGSPVRQWLEAAGADLVNLAEVRSGRAHTVDALVYVEHRDRSDLLDLAGSELLALLGRCGAPVVRICGSLDVAMFEAAGVAVLPAGDTPPGVMAVTTAYCGPRPVIDLHAAGLRAAADVIRAREIGATVDEAVRVAEGNGFALGCEFGSAG